MVARRELKIVDAASPMGRDVKKMAATTQLKVMGVAYRMEGGGVVKKWGAPKEL